MFSAMARIRSSGTLFPILAQRALAADELEILGI
jgi:hypothetical protein